ncbi:hypothetical protein [Amphibacillus cookii]|nr:hypothetical protein [Amphibacillus cookii]MBM7541275.1 hypothetical protein [Amphibacillus cookii]
MYGHINIRINMGSNGFDVRACGVLAKDQKVIVSCGADGTITLS